MLRYIFIIAIFTYIASCSKSRVIPSNTVEIREVDKQTTITISGANEVCANVIVVNPDGSSTKIQEIKSATFEDDLHRYFTVTELSKSFVVVGDKVYDFQDRINCDELYRAGFSSDVTGSISEGMILWASYDKAINVTSQDDLPSRYSSLSSIAEFCKKKGCRCIVIVVSKLT